jgi:hypothetical protein
MGGMKQFAFTEDDEYAIEIAKNVARRLLKHPKIKPQQIIGIGSALYALERLPIATPGAFTEFGIVYRAGSKSFEEMRYIDFRISDVDFVISLGGSVYDEAVGGDSISEPGWLVEIDGFRRTECELYDLEDFIEEYLSLGAELSVNNESDIEFEEGL